MLTVKDLLAMDIDIDVYDNVCEELGIAFCGPMRLTDAGREYFQEVLEYPVTLSNGWGGLIAVVDVDDPDDDVWERKLHRAMEFFNSAAGYCSCENYNKWFHYEA